MRLSASGFRELRLFPIRIKFSSMRRDYTPKAGSSVRTPNAGSRTPGYNQSVGSRTGRSLSALSGAGRGKSELRRAVCRITSGRLGSSVVDGKCHRKYTASAFTGRGKGEKVR